MSPTILIIEDDPDIREGLQELLEIEGYAVQVARNGQEALDQMKQNHAFPKLIFLDLMMPVMDGRLFLNTLRAQTPEVFAQTPIYMLTAASDSVTVDIKTTGIIKKPIEINSLLALAQKHCA